MCPVVRYEYLLSIIDHHTIWKLKVFRASKFIQDVSHLIKNYDTHNLAFHHDYTTFVVYAYTAWMLKIEQITIRCGVLALFIYPEF